VNAPAHCTIIFFIDGVARRWLCLIELPLPEHGVVFTATPAALPLEHDASREAANAMRGFSYQILTSIREWIRLAGDQALFLEGAEDLDIVEEDDATTIQVRDTSRSGNITLRTSGVVDAIGHYWDHRTRNRGRRVSFRYLTTSGVGQESGAPFGRDRKGIEVWQQLKTDPDQPSRTLVAQLKNFLFSRSTIAASVVGVSQDRDRCPGDRRPGGSHRMGDGCAVVLRFDSIDKKAS
jgi:hypothetical protein